MLDSTERVNFIRRYLLGRLPPQDQAAFEDQYLADDSIFEELTATENDLIDDYARGALTRDDHARFLSYFLTTPERRERVAFAGSLREYAASEAATKSSPVSSTPLDTKTPQWAVLRLPLLQNASAFVALLAVAAVIWLAAVNNRMHHQLEGISAQQQELQRQEQALHRQISQLIAQLETAALPAPDPGQAFVTLTLSPHLSRGADPGNVLPLPPRVSEAYLAIKRKPDEHFIYNAVLETVEGQPVWKGSNLPARSINDSTLIIVRLPSAVLSTGDYILKLAGTADDGKVEELDPYTFRVLKR